MNAGHMSFEAAFITECFQTSMTLVGFFLSTIRFQVSLQGTFMLKNTTTFRTWKHVE